MLEVERLRRRSESPRARRPSRPRCRGWSDNRARAARRRRRPAHPGRARARRPRRRASTAPTRSARSNDERRSTCASGRPQRTSSKPFWISFDLRRHRRRSSSSCRHRAAPCRSWCGRARGRFPRQVFSSDSQSVMPRFLARSPIPLMNAPSLPPETTKACGVALDVLAIASSHSTPGDDDELESELLAIESDMLLGAVRERAGEARRGERSGARERADAESIANRHAISLSMGQPGIGRRPRIACSRARV